MTGLKPYLGFIASLAVFALIVAYAAAIQWSPVFRAKSSQATWLAGMAALRVLGFLLGTFAWMGSKAAYWLYVMTEMWSGKVANFPWSWWQELDSYYRKRAFYSPGHAA